MLGTNVRCLDNLNGICGFDTSNSLQTTSLVTDPIAVASNDCAIDCLHKDHCAQAFGEIP